MSTQTETLESGYLNAPILPPKSPTKPLSQKTNHHHHQLHDNYINPNNDVVEYYSSSSLSSFTKEATQIARIAFPLILTGLILYSRSMVSMMFLGQLGELALAGGSLALGFANITGYSVLSGLAMGMEPICGQAFGAKKHSLVGLTLCRTIVLLLLTSLPISVLWVNMERILLVCGQDRAIAAQAQAYLVYSLPDLLAQSLLHPLRIYLRAQAITLPLTLTAALAMAFHLPLNWVMVARLGLGVKGVALASVCTNFLMVGCLVAYVVSGKGFWNILSSSPSSYLQEKRGHEEENQLSSPSSVLGGFDVLLRLAVPSCISVCLEWWWYELMILLCGLLANPKATVASMGILIQTTSLIYIFPSSLGFALSTRVGNELGAGRPERARRATITGLLLSFLMGLSALSFTLAIRHRWATLFTREPEIIRLTTLVLPIIGLCELGNCPQTTGCGVLRGTARPKVGAHINLGCFYLVGMPVAVWLGFFGGFDFQGLWLGLLAAQASCMVVMMVVLNRTKWEFEAQRAKQLTDRDHHQPLLV